MATRVFVRNLPPTISEADFRAHFAAQPGTGSSITDVKHIAHRRIGYVGYKTPAAAETAVKYFNKSYIRMSRIGVELARPAGDEKLSEAKAARREKALLSKAGGRAGGQGTQDKKRKREEFEDSAAEKLRDDKKFKEFLEVMKPRSQTKSWANEDGGLLEQAGKAPSPPLAEDSDDESVENDFSAATKVPSPKKLRDQPQPTEVENVDQEMEDTMDDQGDGDEDEGKVPVSDADWLRSKTSRMLDLTDDVDAHLKEAGAKPKKRASTARIEAEAEEAELEPMEEDAKEEEQTGEMNPAEKSDAESEKQATIEKISETSRLFVRNLSYTATEGELSELFSRFGEVKEVHIPISKTSSASKGFAYILFADPSAAITAFTTLDSTPFQGRLLHILPASAARASTLDEYTLSKLPLKKQREIKRKQTAATSTFNWNSMYMSADAVVSSLASRLGVSKAELLDPTSSGAAVRQALAETSVINETKTYLTANGVDLAAFEKREKDDRVLLLKNFPFGTKPDELKTLLQEFGDVARLLVPPAGTIALAEFKNAPAARAAFKGLAYRRFKESILFLEKGPVGLFTGPATAGLVEAPASSGVPAKEAKPGASDIKDAVAIGEGETQTLFVRNLNFTTTTERLASVFSPISGYLWARVKTKPDAKHPGKTLSMGFGFVEFDSAASAAAACTAMDGHVLDGHKLLVRPANNKSDAEKKSAAAAAAAKKNQTKLVIKNLPFEVTKADVRQLFAAYGQLRSVRLPKKFGGQTRGFAFADFVTAREAENALKSLTDTHLLGRRLVLGWAQADATDAEEEIERMGRKVSGQRAAVEVAKLRGERKKKVEVDETGAVGDGLD